MRSKINGPAGHGGNMLGTSCPCGSAKTRNQSMDLCCVGAPPPPRNPHITKATGGIMDGQGHDVIGGCYWQACSTGLAPSAQGWANQNPQQQWERTGPGCCAMQSPGACNDNSDGCVWSYNWADDFTPYGPGYGGTNYLGGCNGPNCPEGPSGTCFPAAEYEQYGACPYDQWPVGGEVEAGCACPGCPPVSEMGAAGNCNYCKCLLGEDCVNYDDPTRYYAAYVASGNPSYVTYYYCNDASCSNMTSDPYVCNIGGATTNQAYPAFMGVATCQGISHLYFGGSYSSHGCDGMQNGANGCQAVCEDIATDCGVSSNSALGWCTSSGCC